MKSLQCALVVGDAAPRFNAAGQGLVSHEVRGRGVIDILVMAAGCLLVRYVVQVAMFNH